MVWQMLAALVFLAALVARAFGCRKRPMAASCARPGSARFLLCFCWELPRVLVLLFGSGYGSAAADLPEVLFRLWHVLHRRAWGLSLRRGWQEATEGLTITAGTPLV